jgi:glucosamine kinase
MILIADSGASKTDWRIIDTTGSIEQAQTIGFNPYYQPIEQFDQEVREVLVPQVKQPI